MAVSAAAQLYQQGSDKDAQIVKNEFEQAIDQSYRSEVETSNGIYQSSAGESIPGPLPETGTTRQKGSYSYKTPEGVVIRVDWEAGEEGYRAYSDAIPKAPVVPGL